MNLNYNSNTNGSSVELSIEFSVTFTRLLFGEITGNSWFYKSPGLFLHPLKNIDFLTLPGVIEQRHEMGLNFPVAIYLLKVNYKST